MLNEILEAKLNLLDFPEMEQITALLEEMTGGCGAVGFCGCKSCDQPS